MEFALWFGGIGVWMEIGFVAGAENSRAQACDVALGSGVGPRTVWSVWVFLATPLGSSSCSRFLAYTLTLQFLFGQRSR